MDQEVSENQSVDAKVADAEKSSSWSDATSPTATTISTMHTMRTHHHDPPEPKTPPTKREQQAKEEDEEAELDSTSIMTPSQPLHDKLDELEEQWSGKRPSRREDSHYVFAAGGRIMHQPSRPKASSSSVASKQRTSSRKKSVPVEIIGTPDEILETRSDKKQSVFDRLYREGKTNSSRKRRPGDARSFRSMPMPATPQSSSVEGTISTLSSTESIFDRLYKNEKRNRADIPRSNGPRSVASSRDKYRSDSMSAAAFLERRLAYAAPLNRRRNRVSSSGKVASLIQQHEAQQAAGRSLPGTPRSSSSHSPRTPIYHDERSVSSNADSVFDRLYRGKKRKTPLMPEKFNARPAVQTKGTHATSIISPTSPQSSRQQRMTVPLPHDSVFERLYKGEKRKTPLTAEKKRRQESRQTSATTKPTGGVRQDYAILEPSDTSSRVEESLLEESLRDAGDSDDSLLHDDLPASTVLSLAKYSANDNQSSIAGNDVTRTSHTLGKETGSDSVGETLARLKLLLYARRIQHCARGYIARAQCAEKMSRSRVHFTADWHKRESAYSAVSIQRVWRGYRSLLTTLVSLLKPCQLDYDCRGSNEYTGILLLRIKLQSLITAAASAGDIVLTRIQVDERKINANWSKQVVIHFTHNGAAKMETVFVSLKCSISRLSFMKSWGSRRLSAMIVKAALFEVSVRETEKLVGASVSTIQSWARVMLRRGVPSRRPGSILSIRTTRLQFLAQYLTPTSLQQRSAITLQNAWRFHQSQVRAADAMLTNWRVKCDFENGVAINRILLMKVALHALSKAIGRVDCWWITENVRVDRFVVVKWAREVGVHYFSVNDVPHLETCTVCVDCEAIRNVFVEKWRRRKLAILIVKAALIRAIIRDRTCLVYSSATLIQTWFRMKRLRAAYLCKVNACMRLQGVFRSGRRTESSYPLSNGDEDADLIMIHRSQEHSAIIIQSCIRHHLSVCELHRRDKASRRIQRFLRQQHFRRCAQSREAVAMLLIQCSLRSYYPRWKVERNRRKAEIIQKLWRGTSTRDAFSELKRASIVIQTWERRRQCIGLVLSMRVSEICRRQDIAANRIQCLYRGARVRQGVAIEQDNATRIQCAYRRHLAIFSFRKIAAGIVAIQAAHRGSMARRLIFLWHTLVAQSRLALLVQPICRGYRVRRQYFSLSSAVIVVQSTYRRHYARHSFRALRELTVALQRKYRRVKCDNMRAQLEAAERLQKAWRGSKDRAAASALCEMAILENSAITIQKWYRCWEVRGHYLTLRQAAMEIQAFERRRKCLAMYQKVQKGITHIQALCRGDATRMERRSNSAFARLMQAAWRGSQRQRQFKTFRSSVVILQSGFRRRSAMQSYRKTVAGITLLQAISRGQAVRSSLAKQLFAAKTLLAAWRAKRARRLMSITLENRRKQQMTLNSLVVLQKMLRLRRLKREIACILIQRWYRSYVCRESFVALIHAAIAIQAAERRRQALSKYDRLVYAIVCIQARQRGIMTRRRQAERVQTTKAAVLIQSCMRRQCIRQHFLALNQMVVRIQKVERRRQSQASFRRAMHATILLQACLRGTLARQKLLTSTLAATTIQRSFRGNFLRQNFVTLKETAIQIQAVERRRQSLSSYRFTLRGFIKLQAHYRGVIIRTRLQSRASMIDNAAVLVQRCWRRLFVWKKFRSLRRAVVLIQAAERRRRCSPKYNRILRGATYLQACYRGFHARQVLMKQANSEEAAAILVQSSWRRFCLLRELSTLNRMAVQVQAQYRGFLIRRLLAELAAAVIMQRSCRTIVPRRRFLVCRQAAVRLQTMERRRQCLLRYARAMKGVELLQACARGVLVRRMKTVRRQSILRIQAKWRGFLAYERYCVLKTGVVSMQRVIRCHRAKCELREIITGVILLQATHRGVMSRRHFEEECCAAKAIQRAWESHCRLILADVAEEPSVSAAAIVYDPKHFAAVTIQSNTRAFLVKCSVERLQAAARSIQVKYFTWKMQLTLLMVQSSVVLLQRSVRGQLMRSAARFALSHINTSLRSSAIYSYGRVTNDFDPGVNSIWHEWTTAVRSAREAAAIVIQSAGRRMFARRRRSELSEGRSTLRKFVSRNAVYAYKSIATIVPQRESQGPKADIQERPVGVIAVAETFADTDNAESNIRQDLETSALVIQRMVRGRLVILEMRKYNTAACQVQKVIRGQLEMSMYRRFKAGVVCAQSRFRGAQIRADMTSMACASVRLQQEWRMCRDRRRFTVILKLSLVVQTWYRMRSACLSFRTQKQAANVIQNRFRAWEKGILVRFDLTLKNLSTVRVQQEWRAYRECRRYLAIRRMALLLQAAHRMNAATHSFHHFKDAVLKVQTASRTHYARKAFLGQIGAAIRLQATVRHFLARMALRRVLSSAVCVQRIWRGAAARQMTVITCDQDIESTDDADASMSSLDRCKVSEWIHQSIVSQVDRRSKIELDQLLEGDAACPESAGICIRRLVLRATDARRKCNEASNAVERQQRIVISSEHFTKEHSAINVEADSEDADECVGSESESESKDHVINEMPPNSSTTNSASAMKDPSVRSTLDLASQAQELILEARRARVKFQETRQQTARLSTKPNGRPPNPFANETQMSAML